MNTLLELKDISYKVDNNLILNKINLNIKTGEKVALLGKSGAGKTSLISILNGSIKPTSGKVKFLNKEFKKLDLNQKRKLTTIWQDLRLIDGLSAEQNVNCGLLGQRNFLFACYMTEYSLHSSPSYTYIFSPFPVHTNEERFLPHSYL